MPFNWKRDKDDVMLDPRIFLRARRLLKYKPVVDMFASDFHHQLSWYYAMEDDPKAAGKDAFKANWLAELNPYINPPWYLIPACLDKLVEDQAVAMVVVPKREDASLWPLSCDLCKRHLDIAEPIYLRPDKSLWKKPMRDTRIGIFDGIRLVPPRQKGDCKP